MSDDFGTVNVRRGERAREIEVLRQHYRGHREALARLAADAPTEQLAAEYQRLIAGIDEALRKLDDIEGRPATQPGTRPPPPVPTPSMTAPGMRPLSAEPVTEPQRYVDEEPPAPNTGARTLLIVVVGLLVLGAIGYLIWRASRERPRSAATTTGTVVEQPVTPATADTIAPATAPPAATAAPATTGGSLKITPAMADYGIVRKGTRAVRQFEAANNGAAPLTIEVARSNCHCLFYAFNKTIAPHAKETITVTVDGAKAKVGTIDEQLGVTAKNDPTVSASIGVRAVVK